MQSYKKFSNIVAILPASSAFVVIRGHLRPIPKARPLGLYVVYYPEGLFTSNPF